MFLNYELYYKTRTPSYQYARMQCHCGNIFIARVYDVANGRTNSCGDCPTVKLEDYDELTYKITYIGRGKYKGASGLIHKKWYHYLINEMNFNSKWYIKEAETSHALCWALNDNKNSYRVHTLIGKYIFKCDNKKHTVDHINRNELDNSLKNLRVADRTQQCHNVSRTDNKHGFKGVRYGNGTWEMQFNHNKKRVTVCGFKDKYEAALGYNYALDIMNIIAPRNDVDSAHILTDKQKEKILTKLNRKDNQ